MGLRLSNQWNGKQVDLFYVEGFSYHQFRTTLVDNNTWNNSHIAMVGKAMASNEDDAYTIMQELGVDYVLIIFGGLLGNVELLISFS